MMAFDDYETLSTSIGERIDGVATVAIDRPNARNALNQQVRTELKDALKSAEKSEAVRVLVLTGIDEAKAFVAGADINEFKERNTIEQREVSKRPRVYETVDDLAIPVIGRINGHALGGGCELAQACDIRIAHERAKFGQPEINLGIMPGGGATQRLPRLVGEGQTMRLILSGELIDATKAYEIGLIEEVHDEASFDDRVYDLAGTIADKSPIALELVKKAIKASKRMNLDQGIEYEAELFVQLFGTADKGEGISAFLEDRDPEFTGE